MTALPNYPNVHAIRSRRAKITANLTADPAVQRRELAEAAPFWSDENEPVTHGYTHGQPAPQWQDRDGNGRIIRVEFQPLKSQSEIDKRPGVSLPIAFTAMFCAALTVAAIMTAFDWLVGAM